MSDTDNNPIRDEVTIPSPTKSSIQTDQAQPLTPAPSGISSTTNLGFFSSLWRVLTYRSYSVYLITSWILGIFEVVTQNYLLLYLRDIFFDYILIGLLITLFMCLNMATRFLGGYIGDNYNRKWLSVLTMLVSGIGMFIFAFSTALVWIIGGLIILASSSLFASGSTSYIYENIPVDQSGLAIGIFQTSSGFGLIGLGIITWLLGVGTPFIQTIQFILFMGGVCYVVAAIVRIIFLAPAKSIQRNSENGSKLRDFFQQNGNAMKLLLIILPAFMGVLILDAFSDGLYGFVSLFYINEALAFSIGEISLMLIVVLAFSIPLSVTVGGFFDRHGSRRAILIVYSVMPICLVLLILAPLFPYWLPMTIVAPLIAAFPILEPLLSTAFIAMAMKSINDILWWTLILTYLRKAIPRSETAKMLSIFFIIVMLANMFTPIPAGIVYTYFGAVPILFITLGMNLLILTILFRVNIEPKPGPEHLVSEIVE